MVLSRYNAFAMFGGIIFIFFFSGNLKIWRINVDIFNVSLFTRPLAHFMSSLSYQVNNNDIISIIITINQTIQ